MNIAVTAIQSKSKKEVTCIAVLTVTIKALMEAPIKCNLIHGGTIAR
jgi:hypothetical protein